MAIEIPQLNVEFCSDWAPQERDAYTRLPLTLERHDRTMRNVTGDWKPLFDSFDWKPNQGEEQKLIIPEPSPITRQHGYGVEICENPTADKPHVSERLAPKKIYRKAFQAGPFNWCDSYKDFIKNRLAMFLKAMIRDQELFNNLFLRSWIYHQSPYFLVADSVGNGADIPVGGFVTGAPTGFGSEDGSTGKTDNWLELAAGSLGMPGILSHALLTEAVNIMDTDLGAEPYRSGSVEQDSPLNDKYLFMTSSEAYSQLVDDPYIRENRIETEDIVRKGFRGPLCGGRVLASFHSNPLRFYINSSGSVVWPAPQIRVETPGAANFGQVVTNPTYARCPYEIGYMCGAKGYGMVDTGAPPSEFQSNGMSWNGKPKLINDIVLPCENAPGGVMFNYRREWLMWDSVVTFGAVTIDSRQVLPILFRRNRGNRMLLR